MSLPYLQPYLGLSNGLNTLHAAGGPGGGIGGWVELGRSNGTALPSVTSLSDKRYYMILSHQIRSTVSPMVGFRFNGDSGSNYAARNNNNGAASDYAYTSDTKINVGDSSGGTAADFFTVGYIANKSNKEKLMQLHEVFSRHGYGSSIDPKRSEGVSKWANTSNAIDRIDVLNVNTGSFTTGGELIVLGYDPLDSHTNNFWEELVGSASGDLGSDTAVNGTHSTGTFTAKKYLWCQWYGETNTGGGTNPRIRVGNTTIDTGNNYAVRYSHNGAADGTQTSRSDVPYNVDTGHTALFCNMFLINNSANEKLAIVHWIRQNTAGAGNVPNRQETVFKWANTSNQVDILGMVAADGAKVSAGAKWRVWGAD